MMFISDYGCFLKQGATVCVSMCVAAMLNTRDNQPKYIKLNIISKLSRDGMV